MIQVWWVWNRRQREHKRRTEAWTWTEPGVGPSRGGIIGTVSTVVREMAADEVGLVVDYFHDSTPEHMGRCSGVDPTRLPARDDWWAWYAAECGKPVRSARRC